MSGELVPKGLYERILSEPIREAQPVKTRTMFSGYVEWAKRAGERSEQRKRAGEWAGKFPGLQEEWLRQARIGQRHFPEDET